MPLSTGRGHSLLRWVMLLVGLVAALVLPWLIYPPVAMDIAAWALFAISVDLLLGYTGLLSFGHAAFWGSSSYVTGLIAIHWGVPFPLAILGGMIFAMAIAVPIGYLSVRRTGIYFAMVTLAFAQMIYFLANQLGDLTGGENGLQAIPKSFFGVEPVETDAFTFYYAAIGLILLGIWAAWRIVHSPFGRVLVAIRDNPARARALGYDVDRYKIIVFVLSAGLAGLGRGSVRHQPRFHVARGAELDHLGQGGADHRPWRHRHPLGRPARRCDRDHARGPPGIVRFRGHRDHPRLDLRGDRAPVPSRDLGHGPRPDTAKNAALTGHMAKGPSGHIAQVRH